MVGFGRLRAFAVGSMSNHADYESLWAQNLTLTNKYSCRLE